MMNGYEAYMKELAQQMRAELTDNGFTSLETSDDVNQYMQNIDNDDTTFVVINSTCGCAAGLARPAAVAVAEQNEVKPDHKVTVFAGQDKEATQTMRAELTDNGFTSLETSDDVNQYMQNIDNDDTTFVVINSTCGCAAGLARPAAVAVAEQNEVKPDHKVTVFAGQDKEATQTMRDYIQQVPSSPSYALFKGQHLVHFIPREHIEGRDINDIAMDLKDAFDDNCQ